MVRVWVEIRFSIRVRFVVRVMVRLRWGICKLHMRDFEIAQRMLQIAQLDKSCATKHERVQDWTQWLCSKNIWYRHLCLTAIFKSDSMGQPDFRNRCTCLAPPVIHQNGDSTRCNRRPIAMMFVCLSVLLSVCLSGMGMHCDHTVHFSADLSLRLDIPMLWTPWHQSMSTYSQLSLSSSTWKRGGLWMWLKTMQSIKC